MPRKLKNIELNRLTVEEFKNVQKLPICVVLDNVRSMLNVGSVFRTADAFRIDQLLLCGITAQPPHRDITKSAIGAEQSVNWKYYDNTINAVKYLKSIGYLVIAVEQADSAIELNNYKFDASKPVALIFGNEVDGVSNEVIDLCDDLLEIPQLGTKHSLNISVCAGVVIWEAAKPHLHG